MLFVTWDFLFGASLIIASIGLLLLRNWARIMWLGLMPALVLVHLGIIMANQFLGRRISSFYLVWTGMVVLVAALSWWFFTEDKVKARFYKQKETSTETSTDTPT